MSTVPLPPDYYERPRPPRRPRSWKRIAGITAAAVIVVIAVLFIGLAALLHNHAFRQYLIRIAHDKLGDALGAELQVKDFGLHLSGLNPSVDMVNVTISGAGPYREPPLLRVDRLRVAVRIDSFVQHKWYFSDVQVDHPVAQILVDAEGRNNLPHSSAGTQTDLFDLGIRHVLLNDGEIIYNDRKRAIGADLHDVQLQSKFDPADGRYSGTLSYSDGHLRVENLNPMVHGLSAKFESTRTRFKLDQALLTNGASRLELSGTLDDYAHPRVQARYRATVDAGDLRRIVKDSSLPSGVIRLAGGLRYDSDPKRPPIETLTLDGNLAAGALLLRTKDVRTVIDDLTARYTLKKGDLNVRDVRARLLGGSVAGELTMLDVTGAAESRLHAVLRDIGFAQIQALMSSTLPRDVMLTGTADADVETTWRQAFENLVAHADAAIGATIRPIRPSATEAIPLSAGIHARYDAVANQISFERSYVRLSQTSMSLNGTVSTHTALGVRLQSNDLGEVQTLVDAFHPIEPLGVGGAASFAGSVRGTANAPQIAGQLRAASLHVRGTEWRMLQTDIEAGPSRLTLKSGAIQPASRGQLAFDIDTGLTDWTFTETSPIDVNLTGAQLNAADLVNLSGRQFPVSGTVSANVSLHGSRLSPTGKGTVNLVGGSVHGEPVNSVNVSFQGTEDELRGSLDLRMPAGGVQGNFVYFPRQQGYDAQLEATGVRLDQLHALKARNVQVTGSLDLKASGKGAIDNPGFELSVNAPRLQIQNQILNGLTLQASVADHVANVALESQSRDIYLRGQGRVNLTGNYDVDAVFDTSPISLQPFLAAYLPPQANNVTGRAEVHARLRGPLQEKSRLDAHLTIPVLALNYRDTVNLAAVDPIQMDYAKGVLTVQPATIRGTGTDLRVQGTIPVTESAPAAIRAAGAIDLQIAQLFDPEVTSSGQLRLSVDGYGRLADPNVQGQIEIVNANFAAAGAPVGLQNGNGLLKLTNDGLDVEQFRARVGSGALTAKGRVAFRPVQFNLTVAANRIRALYPQGVRETLDANLTLTGSPEAGLMRGQVRLQDISFTRDFDFAELIGQFSGASAGPAEGFANNLRLDIAVQSTNDVNLTSSKLSLQGAANLLVRGDAAEPVVTGRMTLSSGDLIFRGNRYVLQPSTLEFINPVLTEPVLNVEVDSKVQAYDVHMRLRGPLDQLRTTYTSDPSLPEADIINLLVFGKTTEAAQANPAPGNLGAESLVASTVSSQVTNRVEKVAGISQFSVDPVLGNQKNPGARVTLQQRVAGNLFVTFATDATSTGREVIKLEYQMSPRMSVSGVRDQNGGFALDVRIRKTW